MKPKVNKTIIRRQLNDHDDTGYVDATPTERIAIQWELTKMAWKLADPNFDPDAPLRRDIVKKILLKDK